MTVEEHCAVATQLTGSEKLAYMKQHDLTSLQIWEWKRDHANTRQTRAKTKKTRERVLIAQDGACALCGVSDVSRWCLDKSGKVVCNRCNLHLTWYRKLQASGVELEDMREFEIE